MGLELLPAGVGALPHDFAEPYVHYFTFNDARTTAVYEHGITLPMTPFLGVVAADRRQEPVSAIVSRRGCGHDQAVARSVLLIIDPAAPPALRATAAITQELRRTDGFWRITKRTVAPTAGPG